MAGSGVCRRVVTVKSTASRYPRHASPAAGPKPPDGKRRGDRRHADVSHHDRASPIIFSTASPSKP